MVRPPSPRLPDSAIFRAATKLSISMYFSNYRSVHSTVRVVHSWPEVIKELLKRFVSFHPGSLLGQANLKPRLLLMPENVPDLIYNHEAIVQMLYSLGRKLCPWDLVLGCCSEARSWL